jgi:phosphatidyl-myo-inositol dimannoside synthase
MMRVALLSVPPTQKHGWARYTQDVITALQTHGVGITLVTSSDCPDVTTTLPDVRVLRILPPLNPAPRQLSLRLLAASRAVSQIPCDVLHVIAEPYTLATFGTRKPVVVTAHGSFVPLTAHKHVFGNLYRHSYNRSRITAVSNYTAGRVRDVLPDAQITVIPNGVDVSRFANMPMVKKSHPMVLTVGELKPRKGFLVLAHAVRAVRDAVPDVRFVFVGSTDYSPYVDDVKAVLRREGVSDAVEFAGRVPDDQLLQYYAAADAFALPALNDNGRFEGFGLVYLEANAAGLPVIGTRGNGGEDVIRDGETGWLVDQDDPRATADAIIKVLRNPGNMGENGKRHAAQYTWDRTARSLIELYKS